MDYLCWSNLVLGNLISDSPLLFAPKYHGMVAMFQLESISNAIVEQNLAMHGFNIDCPYGISPI
jgi:hypothetical protein